MIKYVGLSYSMTTIILFGCVFISIVLKTIVGLLRWRWTFKVYQVGIANGTRSIRLQIVTGVLYNIIVIIIAHDSCIKHFVLWSANNSGTYTPIFLKPNTSNPCSDPLVKNASKLNYNNNIIYAPGRLFMRRDNVRARRTVWVHDLNYRNLLPRGARHKGRMTNIQSLYRTMLR